MHRLFIDFLRKSEKRRPGYFKSLGDGKDLPILPYQDNYPELLNVIYENVSGTPSIIGNQEFMDFIPGYHVIHVDEYNSCLTTQNDILEGFSDKNLVPFLKNYSSDFVSIEVETGNVYFVYHDDDQIYKIYETPLDFLKTINKFYDKQVYFLDEDGFLDYDEDMEYVIAKKMNPTIGFWNEEQDNE
ncbi:hypothetical protein [Zobellia nedashkovskayae]|uniref:hypothetical protein n=1 Tax=Zobellia nedashkovskayae TaxID=2779510 RepID=UPI00188C606E|nr:hypothetical protein [Zobellia nedashkovskayae]